MLPRLACSTQNSTNGHLNRGNSGSYKFAICLNPAPDSDLEIWKIYRVLNDPKANEVGCLRIIDESGEDYLYPENRFTIVEFPDTVQSQLLAAINA